MKNTAYSLEIWLSKKSQWHFIDHTNGSTPGLHLSSSIHCCCLRVFWVSKCVTNAHHQTFVSHFLAQLQVQRKLSYLDSSAFSKGFHPVGKTPINPIEIRDCLHQPFVNYNLALLQCKCALCFSLNSTKCQCVELLNITGTTVLESCHNTCVCQVSTHLKSINKYL